MNILIHLNILTTLVLSHGPFGGVLLAAISLDANNGIFPVAVGIAEIENKDNWTWFLTNLEEMVG